MNIMISLVLMLTSLLSANINETNNETPYSKTIQLQTQDCIPNTGWRWINGDSQPMVADQVKQNLLKFKIEADVNAQNYGEIDMCGTFHQHGVDLTISIRFMNELKVNSQTYAIEIIKEVLTRMDQINWGNIKLQFPVEEESTISLQQPITIHLDEDTGSSRLNNAWAFPYKQEPKIFMEIKKKVYVVAYNPFIDAEKTIRLWDYLGFYSYEYLTEGTINFFRNSSSGQIQYEVVETTILDEFPVKVDGFSYTVPEYIDVLNQVVPPHNPDTVDYNLIVNDSRLDICDKANRNEIDEVWIFNGPYYGFWESTLVGPGSYWYNSEPVSGPHSCERMIPIMGPNPERGISESVHNFGHRTESTMWKIYDYQWESNPYGNNWEKFSLVDSHTPDYSFSGCGNIHFPPNGQKDYDYDNFESAQTYCDDFVNYPNMHEPTDVLETVTCTTWGCTQLQYLDYWFSHLPQNFGCGPDSVANNWWIYFAYPELALSPPLGCLFNYPYTNYLPILLK